MPSEACLIALISPRVSSELSGGCEGAVRGRGGHHHGGGTVNIVREAEQCPLRQSTLRLLYIHKLYSRPLILLSPSVQRLPSTIILWTYKNSLMNRA